jgi:S-adenosylmethionine:diacylglycerol 3-amino-3-carboxypropyl transferase
MNKTAITFAVLASVIASSNASAQSYFCDRPRKPYIPYSTSRSEMESTRDDVERYTRRMREYIECLANEQNDAVDEHRRVVNDWNSAVSSFNSR